MPCPRRGHALGRLCGPDHDAGGQSAKSIGYKSCPMVGFDYDKVSTLVHVPADYAIAMMLAIGRGTKPAWAKPGYIPLSEVVVTDRF
ncbi:MAG: nitroreductase family protein [Hyphomicrobium aestuarii]|nr:nitroreductase family protein [Hyphomicrobium aestuarii]